MKTILAAVTLALVAPLLLAVPAHAGTAERSATVDRGWLRVTCTTTTDSARCALRLPEGARRIVTHHMVGGQSLGIERTYPYRSEWRQSFTSRRTAHVNSAGVRVSCSNAGQLVRCSVDLPAGTRDIDVTTYVSGENYGGIQARGLELRTP